MGIAVTCRGCGQALQVAAGDQRAEIECLWCGSKSPVPGRAGTPSTTTTAVAAGPPPVSTASAIAAQKPLPVAIPVSPEKPTSQPAWHEQTPYGLEGPAAHVRPELPTPTPLASPSPPPKQAFSEAADDDGSPYTVSDKLNYRCQECGRVLPGEALVCPSCGYNHETGAKHERTYEPVARTWEAGWPFPWRLRLFIISQAVILFLGLLGLVLSGSVAFSLSGWTLIAAMSAFVFGTYDRVTLARTQRGKVTLTHTWRAFFVERPTRTLRLSQYEGITKGKLHEPGFWDWVGFVFLLLPAGSALRLSWTGFILLLPCTLAPAMLFWYYIIHKEVFFVGLTRDHGHVDFTLYRGWNEEHMNDLYETIRVVAFSVETR